MRYNALYSKEILKTNMHHAYIKKANLILRLNCKIFHTAVKAKIKTIGVFPLLEGMYFPFLLIHSSWSWSSSVSHPRLSVLAQYPNKAPTPGDWSTPPLPSLPEDPVQRGSHEHKIKESEWHGAFLRACTAAEVGSQGALLVRLLCRRQQWYLTCPSRPEPQSLDELWSS